MRNGFQCHVSLLLWSPSTYICLEKNPPANAGDIRDAGSTPGLERSPGEGYAIQSSIIAWRIPSTEEPGGLQSIDLQRVEHNWNDLACMHEPSDNVLTVLGARDRSQLPRQCLTNCGEARLWLHSLFLLWEKSQSRGISLSTESCWPGIKVIR